MRRVWSLGDGENVPDSDLPGVADLVNPSSTNNLSPTEEGTVKWIQVFRRRILDIYNRDCAQFFKEHPNAVQMFGGIVYYGIEDLERRAWEYIMEKSGKRDSVMLCGATPSPQ